MPDNITVTEGTSKAIAADDVSSVFYQKIKLDVGADGLSSPFTGTLSAVTNLAAGTITKLGGGTLNNLAGGSVVLTAGTVTTQLAGTSQLLGTANYLGTVGILTAGTVTNLASGSVVVTAATVGTLSAFPLIAGEDQTNDVMKTEQQFSYVYSAAVGTTVIKAAAGFLHGILLGSTTAGGALTIYDNATGTSATVIGLLKASAVEGFYPFNCKATNGIVVANVGTQIYTAVYR